mgnify:CR=1 FL=1
MKNKKTVILILAFLSLFAFLGSAAYTYAKYRSGITGTIGSEIAKWNFVINDEFITANRDTTLNIPLSSLDNCTGDECKVTSGKIAPGSKKSFDIIVDYTDVSLDFNYTLTISDSAIPDLKIEIDGNETENEISKDVIIADAGDEKKESITVIIEWKDDGDADEVMSDEDDTAIGSGDDTEISFNVTLNLTQLNPNA